MKSLARVLGLVLLAAVLLVVAVLFFLTRLFDPNDYKEQIQQAARDQAGVELTLGGDIGWSLFPWLGIELKQVAVAPLGEGQSSLAEVGTLGLGIEVLPLLRRQLRMSDVIIDSVVLDLQRDADGKGNWEQLGKPAEGVASSRPAGESDAQPATAPAKPLDIAIDSVRITNARVSYRDAQGGQTLQLQDVSLSTGALIEGKPFELAFLGLLSMEQPALRARIDLKSVAQFDLGLQRYQLNGLDLKLDASGEPFSGRAVNLQLQADVLADLAAQLLDLDQLRLSLADLRGSGKLRVSQLNSEPALAGQLQLAEFDARKLLAALGQEVPDTADPRALEKVALSARLTGGSNSLLLEDLQLTLDGSQLSGVLGITDFSRSALRVELKGDQLDLDRYLPPTEAGTAASSGSSGSSGSTAGRGGSRSDAPPPPWSDEPVLPLDLLAKLDLQARLELGQVRLTGQDIQQFLLVARARDGRVRLESLNGQAFAGSFKANADIDSRKTPLTIKLNAELAGIDVLALQRAYEVAEQVRGRINGNLQAQVAGNSVKRWTDTLGGMASFDITDGALLGVNLEQQLCRAIALANRSSMAEPVGSEDTPFRKLTGSFRMANGTISGNDLLVALPGIQAKGRGQIELPPQRIDYRLGLLLEGDTREMPDPACQVNRRYVGIEWPLRCHGYLHNAASSCGVDTDGVGRIAAQLLGSEAQRKVEEKLQDRLGEQAPAVRDAIRGLLGR